MKQRTLKQVGRGWKSCGLVLLVLSIAAAGLRADVSVNILSPLDGAVFNRIDSGGSPTTVPLEVSVGLSPDVGQVDTVTFKINQTTIATASTPPFSASFTVPGPGVYLFEVDVTATGGPPGAVTSASSTFLVVDGDPPVVDSFTLSADTIQAGSSVLVEGTFTDDGFVTQVDLFQNGAQIATDDTFPFRFSVTPDAPGTYQYFAIATDDSGNTAITPRLQLAVTSPPQTGAEPPVITAFEVLPAQAEHFVQNAILFEVGAEDDGVITQVELLRNGIVVATTTAFPYTFSETPDSPGTFQYTARVTDDIGNQTTSDPLTVKVKPFSDEVPFVRLEWAVGGNLTFGSQTLVEAVVLDDGTIEAVDFYLDGQFIGSDAEAPYSVAYAPRTVDPYLLTAFARDDDGNVGAVTVQAVTSDFSVALPRLSIASLFDEQTDTYTFTVDAAGLAAPDVQSVAFYVNGGFVGEATDVPYTLTWTPDVFAPEVPVVALASLDSLSFDSPALGQTVDVFPQALTETLTIDTTPILDEGPKLTPLNDDETFITQTYQDLFAREATGTEVEFGLNALESGESRAEWIVSLFDRFEFELLRETVLAHLTILGFWPNQLELAAARTGIAFVDDDTDDHGNTRATATQISANEEIEGVIETPGDVDFFRFNVEGVASLIISTSGNTDTFGRLFNSQGVLLDEDDDDGAGLNFEMQANLQPGAYFISVEHFSLFGIGAYTLLIDTDGTVTPPSPGTGGVNSTLLAVINGLLESETYVNAFGPFQDQNLEVVQNQEERRIFFRRSWEHRYGESPTSQQTLQGQNRILNLAEPIPQSFLTAFIGNETVNGQPVIFDMPDTQGRETAAALVATLLQVRPPEALVSQIENLDPVAQVAAVLEHPLYAVRFEETVLVNSTEVSAGWRVSNWLGLVYDDSYPWLYDTELEWLYTESRLESDMWLYDQDLGWVWTGDAVYPYFWSHREQTWFYYEEGSTDPNWFYNFTTGQWEAH
ncbi:MAG: Ig-like domain-containing protein [Opitutales bacterium]